MKLQIRLPYGALEYVGIIPNVKSDTKDNAYLKKVLPELLENTPMTTYLECESEQQ